MYELRVRNYLAFLLFFNIFYFALLTCSWVQILLYGIKSIGLMEAKGLNKKNTNNQKNT